MAGLTLLGLALLVGLGTGTDASAREIKENGNTYWEVEAGDTFSEIAHKYNIDFADMVKANDKSVVDPNIIFVGDKLLLPLDGKVLQDNTPVVNEVPVLEEEFVEEAPVVVNEAPVVVNEVPVTPEVATPQEVAPVSGNSAKEWIAQRESNGSYDATNGQYIGRYQLTNTYLNGDYSPENQERVADAYVAERYGSWENAQSFWLANGWY